MSRMKSGVSLVNRLTVTMIKTVYGLSKSASNKSKMAEGQHLENSHFPSTIFLQPFDRFCKYLAW